MIIKAQTLSHCQNRPVGFLLYEPDHTVYLNEQYNVKGRNSCKIAALLGLETFDLLRTYELALSLCILPKQCKRSLLELDSHPVLAMPAKTFSNRQF